VRRFRLLRAAALPILVLPVCGLALALLLGSGLTSSSEQALAEQAVADQSVANQTVAKTRLIPPGRLVIAGKRLTCGSTPTMLRNFDGISVSSNVIVLNMNQLKRFPKLVQWLIYYHECGHINLGSSEIEADCYAVRRARREGWLSNKALNEICATFNIVGHGPVHPNPAQRCRDLKQCLKRSGPP
jgi:hypothetical protein